MAAPEPAIEEAPGLIGRLERIASEPAGKVGVHKQIFGAWLALSLPQQLADLRTYLQHCGCDVRLALSPECYRILVLASATQVEKRLFFLVLESLLPILRNETAGDHRFEEWSVARVLGLLIKAESDARLTLAEAGGRVRMSEDHLGRIFGRRTGVSFRQYALSLRIVRAARLLRDPDRPVKSIASSLGYSDPSNFAREFRRLLGISPGQFRQECLPLGSGADA
jgi:AraC-like DNA-binding protein